MRTESCPQAVLLLLLGRAFSPGAGSPPLHPPNHKGPMSSPSTQGLPNTSEKPWTSKEKVQNIKIGVGWGKKQCFDLVPS